jgi:predicted nucleic acid-binding protein
VADTSFFVGLETDRVAKAAIGDFDLGVSAVTLGELRLGVIGASTRDQPDVASRRLATYQLARRFDPLPIDEDVSDAWALLVAQLRAQGRKAPINDTWIAATALAHGLPVVTQDTDYAGMPGLEVITV